MSLRFVDVRAWSAVDLESAGEAMKPVIDDLDRRLDDVDRSLRRAGGRSGGAGAAAEAGTRTPARLSLPST